MIYVINIPESVKPNKINKVFFISVKFESRSDGVLETEFTPFPILYAFEINNIDQRILAMTIKGVSNIDVLFLKNPPGKVAIRHVTTIKNIANKIVPNFEKDEIFPSILFTFSVLVKFSETPGRVNKTTKYTKPNIPIKALNNKEILKFFVIYCPGFIA